MAAQLPERKNPGNGEGRKTSDVEHLSRILDRDIEVLRANLVHRPGHAGEERWADAWSHLESAWQTVRSELADRDASRSPQRDQTSSKFETDAPFEIVIPAMPRATSQMRESRSWFTDVLVPAVSSRMRQIVRWIGAPERRTQLRAAAIGSWGFIRRTVSATDAYLNRGRVWVQARARTQTGRLKDEYTRVGRALQARQEARAREHARAVEHARALAPPQDESVVGHQVEMIAKIDVPAFEFTTP